MASSDRHNAEVLDESGAPADKLAPFRVALPAQLDGRFTLSSWAASLVNGAPYHEPDPEYLSRLLLVQTLTAENEAAVFDRAGIKGLQDAIPDSPGAGTGLGFINDLYIAESDKQDGYPCYMIFSFLDADSQTEQRYTTGAGQLQAQVLRLLSLGVWPIPCQIKRIDRKDKGGRYLFWLYPPD